MNQTAIFQNMTKGEWYNDDVTVWRNAEKIAQLWNKLEEDFANTPYNAFAIKHAVNNTYGKGINPESVEKLRDALYFLNQFADLTENQRELAKEALNASKL